MSENDPNESIISGPMDREKMQQVLTYLLRELQKNSEECTGCERWHGYIGGRHGKVNQEVRARVLVRSIVGGTKGQAKSLSELLHTLGLRYSYGQFVHYVRLDITEVTPTMLMEALRKTRKPYKGK